jgi:hypothetical protein
MDLPPELQEALQNERTDFIVKAERKYPFSAAAVEFYGGFIALALLFGVYYYSGDYPLPWYVYFAFAGFTILGVLYVVAGFSKLISIGPWFVATPERLVMYSNRKLYSWPWNAFSGSVVVDGFEEKGSLELEFRISHEESSSHPPAALHIIGVPKPYFMQACCSERVLEAINKK